MTPSEALDQVADRYAGRGYVIDRDPDDRSLPAGLRGRGPKLVARRDGRALYVETWLRGVVQEPPPDPMPAGWDYEAILMPADEPADAPGPGPAATPEFTARLLTELEEYVPAAARHSRLLLAWAAAESAMRVAAGREGIDVANMPPRQLFSELVWAGVMSNDQADAATGWLKARNRLAHGTPVEPGGDDAIREMVGLARELLTPAPLAAAG